jgi:glycosyltransferase involved in cell wall biosynthesis
MPNLLVITPYPELSADTRYRISQFIPFLLKNGWQVSMRPFMDERLFTIYHKKSMLFETVIRTIIRTISRLLDCFSARKYDVIFIHKEAFPFGPPIFEKLLAKLQPNIIYDMDDAFWTHPPQFNQIGKKIRDKQKIQKIIKLSKLILAGNEYILYFVKQINPNAIYFPTVMNTEIYQPRKELEDDFITIGWVGRWSSQDYLCNLIPVYKNLIKKFDNLRFCFVGVSDDFTIEDLPIVKQKWTLENEIDSLIPFDIGIMPLPDDGYSKGKCGFKLLQYMALGIPSVASPVGVNSIIVSDGDNGFLAKSHDEWEEKLCKLISDKSLRKTIGQKGRKSVEQFYSLDNYHNILLDQINKVAN